MDEGQPPGGTLDSGHGASSVRGYLLGARSFPGLPEQVLLARMFVETMANAYLNRNGDLKLLTSELVTNSIRHTSSSHGHVTVFVWRRGHVIRVEVVDDGGPTEPAIRTIPVPEADPLVDEGRGLYLVEQIADSWNTYADEAGRTTWFELADKDHQAHVVEKTPGPAPSKARRGIGSHVGLVPP